MGLPGSLGKATLLLWLILGVHVAPLAAIRVPRLHGGSVESLPSAGARQSSKSLGATEQQRKLLQSSGSIQIPAGASRVMFTTFMEFSESTNADANNTELLQENYLKSVSDSLGVPLEDVFPVDTMITYYRFSNPAESLTYLAEAEIKTMVIYGDAASAEAAYNTIAVDPVAWGSQTFTTATFPTLIFLEVYEVEFIPVEAPPAPPPPSYPGGKWPLVFSTSMFYGESGSTFSVRDARDDYVRILMETMGVQMEDIVIRFIDTVYTAPESSAITQQTFDTTLLYDSSEGANSGAATVSDPSWSTLVFSGFDMSFPGIVSSSVSNIAVLDQVLGNPPAPPAPSSYGNSFALEFKYILSLCICSANPVGDEAQLYTNYQSLISQIMGVPAENVLVTSGDVVWVDFSNTYDNAVQTSRLISDADFNTAVLFATEAEAQQALAFFINGGWTTAIAEVFGEAYVSSRVASMRLVYPSGYVPTPVEYPQGSYPVTFTTYFTITFDPSQTTLEEYLAQFSAKYIETLAADLGIPSSSVIIRDIRVSEVSYSTSSATYALEVDAMVLFTSSSTQMQFYQLALSGTLSMPGFVQWPEVVEVRAGDAELIEVVEPTFAPYPPPPTVTPSYPPPTVTPSYPPPPYVSPERPPSPDWDLCSSILEFVVQVSFDSPDTADVVSIPGQVDRAMQTCYDKLGAAFGGPEYVFVTPGAVTERITQVTIEGSMASSVTTLARLDCAAVVSLDTEEDGQLAYDMVNDPSWASAIFTGVDFGIGSEVSRARVTSSYLAPLPAECYAAPCNDYYVISWTIKTMPYRKTVEKGDESSEGMRWPSDLEKEWDEHTLPDLRAIIAWKMDVTPDSGLIQHNPSCDVEYKMEGLHNSDCSNNGMKKIATFRSLFLDYNDAMEFKNWVLYEGGLYPTSTLLTTNPYLCGAKVREGARDTIAPFCEGQDAYSGGCDEYSEESDGNSYAPPDESSSNKSPRESDEYGPEGQESAGYDIEPLPDGGYYPPPPGEYGGESYAPPDESSSSKSPRESHEFELYDEEAADGYDTEPLPDGGYYPPPPGEYGGESYAPPDESSSSKSPRESYDLEAGEETTDGYDIEPLPADGYYPPPPGEYGEDSYGAAMKYEGESKEKEDEYSVEPLPAEDWVTMADLAEDLAETITITARLDTSGKVLERQSKSGDLISFLAEDDESITQPKSLDEEQSQCEDVFKVYWDLVMLPGAASSDMPQNATAWPPAADAHFYINTDRAIKDMAKDIATGLGADPFMAEQIRLHRIRHMMGVIDGSSCPRGLLKQARYVSSFESAAAAARFRDWIERNSATLVDALKSQDQDGFCDAWGRAGRIEHEQKCE